MTDGGGVHTWISLESRDHGLRQKRHLWQMKPFEISSVMPLNDSRGSKTNDHDHDDVFTISVHIIIMIVIIILGWEYTSTLAPLHNPMQIDSPASC